MQSIEQWRPVPGFEGIYDVSDQGRVLSRPRLTHRTDGRKVWMDGRILASHLHRGYPTIRLHRAGTRPIFRVHCLVLLAFVGPRPAGMEGCHNDGDKANCVLSNLRWDTRSENMRDRIRHGTDPSMAKTHCPRGHRLEAPNLIPFVWRKHGWRTCLACNRGLQKAKRRGEPFDPEWADRSYAEIMASP